MTSISTFLLPVLRQLGCWWWRWTRPMSSLSQHTLKFHKVENLLSGSNDFHHSFMDFRPNIRSIRVIGEFWGFRTTIGFNMAVFATESALHSGCWIVRRSIGVSVGVILAFLLDFRHQNLYCLYLLATSERIVVFYDFWEFSLEFRF